MFRSALIISFIVLAGCSTTDQNNRENFCLSNGELAFEYDQLSRSFHFDDVSISSPVLKIDNFVGYVVPIPMFVRRLNTNENSLEHYDVGGFQISVFNQNDGKQLYTIFQLVEFIGDNEYWQILVRLLYSYDTGIVKINHTIYDQNEESTREYFPCTNADQFMLHNLFE